MGRKFESCIWSFYLAAKASKLRFTLNLFAYTLFSMNAVEIKDLFMVYPGGVKALEGASLTIKEGDFFALLGPNGAGKTTLINILTHLLLKTSGKVFVFGLDLDKDLMEIKKSIGLVPQEFNFDFFESVEEILIRQSGFYGVPRRAAKLRTEHILKKLHLWDKRKEAGGRLSGGMKRRLMIARALVHQPKLLLLDEPTTGIDVELRKITWQFLKELNASGTTIILTTHYLEEAEILCNHLAVINFGKIVKTLAIGELLAELEQEVFIVSLKQEISKELCNEKFPISRLDATTFEVKIRKPYTLNAFFEWLSENELESISIKNKSNRLESLLTGLTA